jgi:hypothetical protein
MNRFLSYFSPAVLLLLASCLGSDDVYEYSSEAAITSFSIGSFNYKSDYINKNGHDTILTISTSGTFYPMTIDQKNNIIFNVDSLPYGSNMNSVLTTIASNGVVLYRSLHLDNTYNDTLWTSTDSVNLSKTTNFIVWSEDLTYKRVYEVRVNVHKVHPDSMKWKKVNLPVSHVLINQTALLKNDSIFIFGKDNLGRMSMTSLDCKSKTIGNKILINGLDETKWTQCISLFRDTLYTLQDGSLFGSVNGSDWVPVNTNISFKQLIPFNGTKTSDGYMWAIGADNKIVSSKDMRIWTSVQDVPTSFPDTYISGLCYTLPTNKNVYRNIIVGIDKDSNEPYASVWTKLSTESKWTEMTYSSHNSLRCPRLNNLSIIYYDNEIFAFGGKSQNGFGSIPGLNGFFQSSDNGVTWRNCENFADGYCTWNKYMEFPNWLKGRDIGFTGITDGHGYIWIFTDEGDFSYGAINRLAK